MNLRVNNWIAIYSIIQSMFDDFPLATWYVFHFERGDSKPSFSPSLYNWIQ